MIDVLLKQIDGLQAQLQIALTHLEAIRHQVRLLQPPPAASIVLPARCQGVPATDCARQDGEWISRRSFGDPARVRCDGCDYEGVADG